MFQTISRNTQGGTAHHIQATGVSRRTVFLVWEELWEIATLSSPQRSKRGQYKPPDDIDEVVIQNNVQEFYTHRHPLLAINNPLSVLKTDIMSTIHQNEDKQETIS